MLVQWGDTSAQADAGFSASIGKALLRAMMSGGPVQDDRISTAVALITQGKQAMVDAVQQFQAKFDQTWTLWLGDFASAGKQQMMKLQQGTVAVQEDPKQDDGADVSIESLAQLPTCAAESSKDVTSGERRPKRPKNGCRERVKRTYVMAG